MSLTRDRAINTGHGTVYTRATPQEIAAKRAEALSTLRDHGLFMDTFLRIRTVAASLPDEDALWVILGGYWIDPVIEAAAIEALASLRAEGLRL